MHAARARGPTLCSLPKADLLRHLRRSPAPADTLPFRRTPPSDRWTGRQPRGYSYPAGSAPHHAAAAYLPRPAGELNTTRRSVLQRRAPADRAPTLNCYPWQEPRAHTPRLRNCIEAHLEHVPHCRHAAWLPASIPGCFIGYLLQKLKSEKVYSGIRTLTALVLLARPQRSSNLLIHLRQAVLLYDILRRRATIGQVLALGIREQGPPLRRIARDLPRRSRVFHLLLEIMERADSRLLEVPDRFVEPGRILHRRRSTRRKESVIRGDELREISARRVGQPGPPLRLGVLRPRRANGRRLNFLVFVQGVHEEFVGPVRLRAPLRLEPEQVYPALSHVDLYRRGLALDSLRVQQEPALQGIAVARVRRQHRPLKRRLGLKSRPALEHDDRFARKPRNVGPIRIRKFHP